MSEEKKKKPRVKDMELVPVQDGLQEENSIDLYELLLKFLDKWRWIALCSILGAILMLFYTIWFVTPEYKATSKIYVVSTKDSVINLSDLQISTYLANDYTEVYSNWELHEEVLRELENRQDALKQAPAAAKNDEEAKEREWLASADITQYTYSKLNKMISISNPSGTRILYITITSPDRIEAKVLANTYAEVSKEFIAARMDTNAPKEFERAMTPISPSSPNKTRNTLIGFIVGMLLALAVITLRYLVDDYVRTADDVEKYLHLPTLGTIMLQKQSDDAPAGNSKRGRRSSDNDDDDE